MRTSTIISNKRQLKLKVRSNNKKQNKNGFVSTKVFVKNRLTTYIK